MSERTALVLQPVRSVVFLLIFVIGSLIVNKDVSGISNWWSVVATVVNAATIALLVAAAKKNGMTYRELINYRKGKTKISHILVISVVVLLVGMGVMYLAGFLCYGQFPYLSPMMIEPIPPVLAIINIPLLPVTTALAEDGLYLGAGVNGIKNKYASVLVPAFFFALQHSFIPTLFDLRYIIYRFISFLPLTIILCAYYRKERDPLPIMIGHAIIDLATVMWILATSVIPGFYETMTAM
ncbi:MAG: hypothetical protein J6O50_14110 [Ruminiclostridium sp.]|nr:hypothetical protein [Ruminiclostridium sp.]